MQFDVTIALTWILFLAIFPMAFFWFRRAWRIFVKKDYSEVALKKGDPPKNPQKYAPRVGLLNLIAGCVAVTIIVGVLIGYLSYDSWTAMAGTTIWCKIFADFVIKSQAHPMKFGKKKRDESN